MVTIHWRARPRHKEPAPRSSCQATSPMRTPKPGTGCLAWRKRCTFGQEGSARRRPAPLGPAKAAPGPREMELDRVHGRVRAQGPCWRPSCPNPDECNMGAECPVHLRLQEVHGKHTEAYFWLCSQRGLFALQPPR